MKKLIFLFAAATLALTSCEGPMGPPGPQGMPGQNGQDGQDGRDGQNGQNGRDGEGTNWFKTNPITIRTRDWQLDGNAGDLNSYYYCKVRVPQLTQHIYNTGSVVAYIENLDGKKNGMPFVYHRGDVGKNGEDILWTETYDFDFYVEDSTGGWVTFYLTYSDFNTQVNPEEDKTFYIVAFWQ